MSKNFKFYCPAEISKAKDTEGNTVMKMGGIASTIDEDSDGEFLDPNGFIIDEFLELGLVNWHHQAKDSPMSVIGEPTLAEIRPEGFYVECELYKSSAMAKEVYELGETMQKDSRKRRLGFSIEGSVIERESDDKTSPLYYKIKKALITGLAITHMPKNAKTFADIIKGKGATKIGEEEEDEEDEIEKDLSTTSGAAIVKESLDKNLKVTTFKSKYFFVEMTDEKMFDNIFASFPDISIEKAEKINELLTKIKEGMKSSSDSEMDTKIEKAMDILGFNAKEANPFIEKAKDDAEELTPEQIATKMDEKIYGEDSKVVVDSDKTPKVIEEEEEEEAGTEKLEKSILSFILKSSDKASKENGALGVLLKANLDQNAIMKAQFSEQSEKLEKAMETISLLKTQIGGTSAGRKSIIKARPIEKESFQKAQDVNVLNSSVVLSKSRDYAKVLDLVDKYCDQENMRPDLSKAVMDFEGSKILPSEVASEIKMKFGITIVD